MVPGEQLAQALSAGSLSAKGARFVSFAELAGLEALQVKHASTSPMSGSGGRIAPLPGLCTFPASPACPCMTTSTKPTVIH